MKYTIPNNFIYKLKMNKVFYIHSGFQRDIIPYLKDACSTLVLSIEIAI